MAEIQAPAAVVAPGNGERLTLEEWVEYFKFQRERGDSPSEARNILLIIAVLITTATYQAVLSPPGGFWQETTKATENGVKGHQAGKTIFSTGSFDYAFLVFIITNTAGFFGSLILIGILTEGFPLRLELGFTILTLIASYDSAMYSIIPDDTLAIVFLVCSVFFPLLLEYAAKKIRKARHQGRNIWDVIC